MNDDLEQQLDEFYRKLDGPARRVEARWKSTPTTREGRLAAWLGAGIAAAAAILLVLSASRTSPKPAEPEVVVRTPATPPRDPAPRPTPEPPAPAPKPVRPAPVEPPRVEDPVRVPEPAPEPKPAPVEPRPEPKPEPRPAPEAPKPTPPAPTQVLPVVASLREVEGTFDLSDRNLRGKQKDLTIKAGDRLKASTAVKITLADDRFVLVAPRSILEFRPEEKRLSLSLEQGEMLADLVGPGPEVRVVTRSCEVIPLGTVFDVRVDPGRVLVVVEKGRVEVQSAKGRASLRAAESIQASEDGVLGTPAPADFRSLGWARAHRAAEVALLSEDFTKRGAARAVAKPGMGQVLQLAPDKPLFEVPVRGAITIVCRADRAGKFKVQLYSPDLKTTYTKQNIGVLRGDAWRTVTIDFDELVASDKSKPARMTPGSAVTDLLIMYGDEGERGSFWVDSLKVTEVRP